MKHLIVALFAGTLALSSLSALAADAAKDEMKMDQPKAETKPEKAKDYVKRKAHNTKVKSKRAGKRVKNAVKNRKTVDPSQPNESKPDAAPVK